MPESIDDPDEQLLSVEPTIDAVEGTIVVPAGATPGLTRMRVVMRYHEAGGPLPTGSYEFGEVEDYAFTVMEAE